MIWFVSVGLLLIATAPARAYIDPGTGSYLLQIAVAGLMGAVFALKLSWARVRSFARGLFAHNQAQDCPRR